MEQLASTLIGLGGMIAALILVNRIREISRTRWALLGCLGCIGIAIAFGLSAAVMLLQPPFYSLYLPALWLGLGSYCLALAMRALMEIVRIPKARREAAWKKRGGSGTGFRPIRNNGAVRLNVVWFFRCLSIRTDFRKLSNRADSKDSDGQWGAAVA